MLTSLFSLFYVTGEFTGFYTEDEPTRRNTMFQSCLKGSGGKVQPTQARLAEEGGGVQQSRPGRLGVCGWLTIFKT